MTRQHHYTLSLRWTGNQGSGTSHYRAYSRDHDIAIDGKPVIRASSDPAFRGDPARHNPEELLLAALSSCHMLWFLHLCAVAGHAVSAYEDRPEGTMIETPDGGGQFSQVTLYPKVRFAAAIDATVFESLHARANALCFIANSVNFPVHHQAEILSASP